MPSVQLGSLYIKEGKGYEVWVGNKSIITEVARQAAKEKLEELLKKEADKNGASHK